jgi:putative N6-adenine-specific DNA methylase
LLSADMMLPKLIRLAVSKRTPLFNGALECRLFEYKMVEGGMRKKKSEELSNLP